MLFIVLLRTRILTRMKNDDPRKRVTAICLGFPAATSELCGDSHVTYRVRKKVFAYFLDNHHGDGIIGACVKVAAPENAALVKQHPERYFMPAYIGPKGWLGMRLDVKKVDWDEVAARLAASYAATSPRR